MLGVPPINKGVLSQIGKTIVPVFKPMGVSEENWPVAVGIFAGILAKEAVVGTLDSLYNGMGAKMKKLQLKEHRLLPLRKRLKLLKK